MTKTYMRQATINRLLEQLKPMLAAEDIMVRMDLPALRLPSYNMQPNPGKSWHCHTAACIGGWLSLLQYPKEFNRAEDFVTGAEGRLKSLFYPGWKWPAGTMPAYFTITNAQAIVAIDKYLDANIPEIQIWDHLPKIKE